MPSLIPALYVLSVTLLVAAALLVLLKAPPSPIRRDFPLTCLALVMWLGSEFALFRGVAPAYLTEAGRINFASILLASYLGYVVICELVGNRIVYSSRQQLVLIGLAILTLLTPLIDRAEIVQAGALVTQVGVLFPVFAVHVVAYPAAALYCAAAARQHAAPRLRRQLAVIGFALALTASVIALTGIVLPFGFHRFGLQELGALSIVVLAAAIAYSITVQRLFDIRLVIRHALVITLLIAFVEQVYSESISLLVDRLPPHHPSTLYSRLVQLATVLAISISFHPLQRWLEKSLDRLLFGRMRRATAGRVLSMEAERRTQSGP